MTFGALVGHDRAVRLLRGAAASGRPAHAYLVSGASGLGKRTLAGAFTASLLCDAPVDGEPCGRCAQCTRVASGTHPDVLVVRREAERRDIRTEQARELTRWFVLRPLMAARKVAIVEDAECLNEHGQNALLKTLEEPPGASVLVLLASEESLLLPTVRSRCQRIRLEPLSPDSIERILADRGVAADVHATVVPRAEGSPGRALALAAEPNDEARRRMLAQLAALDRASAADLSATAQALGRDDVGVALETAVSWYRDVLDVAAGGPEAPVRNVELAAPVRAAARRAGVERTLRALETVCDTIRAIDRNANRTLALETMLLALRRVEHESPAS